jgi:hypothetical protein
MAPVELEAAKALLDSRSMRVRRAAADALVAIPGGADVVDEVLRHGSVGASHAVVESLAKSGSGGMPLQRWVEGEIRRGQQLGRWRRSLDADGGAASGYLAYVLDLRRRRVISWAILALSSGETRDRLSLVSRAVWVEARDIRAQAVEALDAMSRDVVGAAMMEAFDDPADEAVVSHRAALEDMAGDFDRWIASLAALALTDEADTVRVAPGLEAAVESIPTLEVIDRVMALAQVPLFAALDPEDLELIADVSGEVRYEAGEAVYRAGEPGNSMLIVIEGEAIVSHGDDRARRVSAVLGTGEPVGELSLLRGGEPRNADVTAGEAGLHGLVVQGPDLLTILQERPEVAMSMLATLAERLGRT